MFYLKMMPESFRKGNYCLLEHLVGMSIIKIGRVPECFSKSSLKAMYHLPFADDDTEFEDPELIEKVKKLENGDRRELLDFDIPVTFSVIEQFSKELGSINQVFTDVANLRIYEVFLISTAE